MFRIVPLSLVIAMAAGALGEADSSAPLAGRTAYGQKDLTFKEINLRKDGKVEIVFSAMLESINYCPGANAKTTEKGIELTFVRSWIERKPKVTYPAKRVPNEKPMLHVIVVDAGGKTIFLRDGKKLVTLFPKDKD